ncbi:MAG: hypothetical protein JMDDDDMK_04551 [Acidobacteria bacterium]|nr:hypothetical protein [Acidobacteriota bacterium]
MRCPDVDVCVLRFVGRHRASFNLPGPAPVNHLAFADQFVGEIVQHALGHIFVGEICADEALATLLSGDAADALNRGRVKPLPIRRAAFVDGKKADAAHFGRVGESRESLAVTEAAEFAHREFLAAHGSLLVHHVHLPAPDGVAAGVLLVNGVHDFPGFLRLSDSGEGQKTKDKKE